MKPLSCLDVVIFGIGEVAEVAQYYIDKESDRRVVAFTVDGRYIAEDTHRGLPVVPFDEVVRRYPPLFYEMYVAMSFRNMNRDRAAKVAEAEAKGYSLMGHISPKAVVWDGFVLRPNTFIMEQNVVQPYVTIGKNVTLWSGNHIGHHTTIEDNVFIASHAVISGHVRIGEGSFVGVNATIVDNVDVGPRSTIGAGALITKGSFPGDRWGGARGTLLNAGAPVA